jgi:uncharacterized damage-inducible protein DinB
MPLTLQAQDPVTSSLNGLYGVTKGHIMATAEMLDEELYAYRPSEEVRSVGELLGHIANAQYLFCSSAAGEDSPNSENIEETRTSKADIVAALESAFAYCDGVFEKTTDAMGTKEITFFGGANTVHGVLAFNSAHNYEHYGNLVTYMRINGITPPSSM